MAKKMPLGERKSPPSGSQATGKRSDARRTHSIRFTESEWNLVEKAAARHGIPAGELVRTGSLALAEDRLGESARTTMTPGHLALIETMWRMVYVLATINREQMIDDNRFEELDELVAAARRAMADTMDEDPV